jgi:uncharacterized protein involved in type VI secretion and phage assembly
MATDMSWLKQLDGALRGDHPALRVGDLPYELTVDVFSAAMPHRLAVVSLTAEERLNGLYEYNIELVTAFPPEVFQPALFGQNASLLLRTPGHDGRVVKGLISALQACGVADRGLGKGLFRYVATLVPRLWLWTQRKRNRVFQDKSVVDVATEMLKADKLHFKVKLRDEGKEYPKQPLFYQRDETDFDFFTRILARAGIFFYFQHASKDSSTTGGIISGMGAAAANVAALGGAMSSMGFGGKTGAQLEQAGDDVGDTAHANTVLILGDDEDHVTALQDNAAINDAAGTAASAGISGALGAMGISKSVTSAVADAVQVDQSDALIFDDGYGAAPKDECVFSFSATSTVRPKAAFSLERDHTKPRSWANHAQQEWIDAAVPVPNVHLSLGRNGLSGSADIKTKLNIDTPFVKPEEANHELVNHNAWWLNYPCETLPTRGSRDMPVFDHDHLAFPLEQLRVDAATALAETDCRRLGAGTKFTLKNHPSASANLDYTVMQLAIVAVDPDMVTADDPRLARPYRAIARCIPADVAPRPPLPEKRKLPMELATVVRWHDATNMAVEERNDVHVRLAWDITRDPKEHGIGTTDGREKPYPKHPGADPPVLRVPLVQPWAGAGYGLQAVPREGMQVVLGYLDDQSDRPIILGCLHSDDAPPPWGGLDAHTVGFRTKSRPLDGWADQVEASGGYSEISISDEANNEVVTVHAAKDLRIAAVNERLENAGGNAIDDVKGTRTTSTNGDATESFGGNVQRTLAGSETTSVSVNRTERINGAVRCDVGKDVTRTVRGNVSEHIVGSSSTGISGERTENIHGARTSVVFGPCRQIHYDTSATTVSGNSSMTVGTADDPANANVHVAGDGQLVFNGNLDVIVAKRIRVSVGSNVLTISRDGITLAGNALTIEGDTTSVLGAKSSLVLDDDVKLSGKKIDVKSPDGGTLSLSSNAELKGTNVSLGSGAADATREQQRRDTEAATLNDEIIHLYDRDCTLCQGGPYEVSASGYTQAGTSPDGTVSIPKFPNLELCHVRWGRPQSMRAPGDPTAAYEFDTDVYLAFDSPNDDENTRRKLFNLGYRGDLAVAVAAFQDALGMLTTGRASDIKDALAKQHGGAKPVDPFSDQ